MTFFKSFSVDQCYVFVISGAAESTYTRTAQVCDDRFVTCDFGSQSSHTELPILLVMYHFSRLNVHFILA